ncbi:MAG: hypothetical protein HC836_47095 [Richelia sp. RM2_1_2]|nr:hypothetical protein [Richelia sp. RM2_1_2]
MILKPKMRQAHQSIGIVYLAWGDEFIFEAEKSRKSTEQLGLPTCLLTIQEASDETLAKTKFSSIYRIDFKHKGLMRKSEIYEHCPFDLNLFLDTDTLVYSKDFRYAFQKTNKFNMSLVTAPRYMQWSFPSMNKIRRDFPNISWEISSYNSGVIFFRKCKEVESIFNLWKELASKYPFVGGDQNLLSLAIEILDFNPYILPVNYNFRGFWQFIQGEIKVWHSRFTFPENYEHYLENFMQQGRPYFYDNKNKSLSIAKEDGLPKRSK